MNETSSTAYVIVSGETLKEFHTKVNDFISKGYQPQGGVAVDKLKLEGPPIYYQAMFNKSKLSDEVSPYK